VAGGKLLKEKTRKLLHDWHLRLALPKLVILLSLVPTIMEKIFLVGEVYGDLIDVQSKKDRGYVTCQKKGCGFGKEVKLSKVEKVNPQDLG
jgi:hypothetical protein